MPRPKRREVPFIMVEIKKQNLSIVINSLKNMNSPCLEEQSLGKQWKNTKHCCSLDLYSPPLGRVSQGKPSRKQLLMYTLRNAVSRHDWSVAAQCVNFMLDMPGNNMSLIYRVLLLILFNHPSTSVVKIQQFLSEVLNLRTLEEQSSFIGEAFFLPEDLELHKKKYVEIIRPHEMFKLEQNDDTYYDIDADI